MRLTETDQLFIYQFVQSEYSNVVSGQLEELVGEAIIYLSEMDALTMSSPVLSRLKEHLSIYREKQSQNSDVSRHAREKDLSNLGGVISRIVSDVDKLDFVSTRTTHNTLSDKVEFERMFGLTDQHESERTEARVDSQIESWLNILPPAEAEALATTKRIYIADHHPWTIGIGRTGVQMLFRRACIRMLWKDFELAASDDV